MKISERDASILKRMLMYCEEIEEYVTRFGDDFIIFKTDNAYRGACSLNILQIGELSGNLTEEFKAQTAEMPWRDIKGMRNIVAHGYGRLDAETTWNTIKEDIPILKEFCIKKIQKST